MDGFNAKKDRAKKLRKDKNHDRAGRKKGNVSQVNKSKPIGTNINSKGDYTVKNEEESGSSSSDSEENKSQKYARAEIISNQSYYDDSLSDATSEPCAASLEQLAAADDVTGGIFQFKGEADWASCPENISNEYFHIDLQQLAASLSAVPFYDRVDLFHDFFSSDEKREMDFKAEQQYKLYTQNFDLTKNMKGLDRLLLNVINQKSQELESSKTVSEPDFLDVSALITQFKNIRPDLTDLLLTTKTESIPVPGAEKLETSEEKAGCSAKDETEGLTEWLDSILDD